MTKDAKKKREPSQTAVAVKRRRQRGLADAGWITLPPITILRGWIGVLEAGGHFAGEGRSASDIAKATVRYITWRTTAYNDAEADKARALLGIPKVNINYDDYRPDEDYIPDRKGRPRRLRRGPVIELNADEIE